MRVALHADPKVRRELPDPRIMIRVVVGTWALTAVVVAVTSMWAGSRYGALVTVLPVAYMCFLSNRLARGLEGSLGRFWRVLTIGTALVSLTFVTIGLRALISSDVLFVILGLLVPSAIFFLTYGMWIRLQVSSRRPSTLGFFDVVLVVTVGLAYVAFLLTSNVFVGAGQGLDIGVFILVSSVVVSLMALVLVTRRRRGPGLGIGVEVVLATVMLVSVLAVAVILGWESVTGRPIDEVPAWLIAFPWVLVFSVALLAPYAEDGERQDAVEPVTRVRPFWPYFLLALTPPIAIGSLLSTQQEQKLAGVIGLLLVVEVLVVRQLVLIDEQRRARVRQHRLRDLAAAEARRTNVILDLALSLARDDDPRAMCDTVATAVGALEEEASVAVFGRLEDGGVAAATRGVDDPATMYSMLGQLRLTSSQCVRVAGPWFGSGAPGAALVAAVIGAVGDRLGYVVAVPAEAAPDADVQSELEGSIAGVADQLALALDRAGLLDAVRTDTDRVRESVDRLSEGVAVVGPDDRVRACNRAFVETLGIDADATIGAPLPPRLLARLPVDQGVASTGSWTSAVDVGSEGSPLPLQVSVFLSETDPLEDGVVVVVDDSAALPGERERLVGILDDLVNAVEGDSAGSRELAALVAHRLAAGLRREVEAPLLRVRSALAADAVTGTTVLAEAVGTACTALRSLYAVAAREARG
ncbi:MAG: hypothetical protein U0U69_06180 [Acidimicrobiia bacterium]